MPMTTQRHPRGVPLPTNRFPHTDPNTPNTPLCPVQLTLSLSSKPWINRNMPEHG